jgi:hypothetical protein
MRSKVVQLTQILLKTKQNKLKSKQIPFKANPIQNKSYSKQILFKTKSTILIQTEPAEDIVFYSNVFLRKVFYRNIFENIEFENMFFIID